MTELKVDATLENLERVLSFVEERLETCSCSMKTIMQIQIAVEEIYVNIASYAYKEKKGEAIIKIETDQEVPQVSLTFEDYGDPYNPLLKEGSGYYALCRRTKNRRAWNISCQKEHG